MNTKKLKKFIVRTLPLISFLFLFSCSQNREVTVKELSSHVKYLSSDSLKGRLTGSEGDSLAADYIMKELTSFGLVPLSGDGFQRFEVTKRIIAGKNNSLNIGGTNYTADMDFMPLAFSANGNLQSDVVFAGYGFKINADS